MNEIAMTASFIRLSVDQKILASCTGPTPSNRPATIAAKKHPVPVAESQDRKSTRLNSSHSQISYAVFCLKKKTKLRNRDRLLQRLGRTALPRCQRSASDRE